MEEPLNPLLDDYILARVARPRPRVAFLGTASGDSDFAVANFYRCFPTSRCDADAVPLFVRTSNDLEDRLLHQDVIYVGGGNTANLLAIWRVHGVDRILRRAVAMGVILAGVS